MTANEQGKDTATGTDPDAKYEQPGYEDKSFGQAGNEDQELAERLLKDSDGDVDEASKQFEKESSGAPVLDEQEPNSFDPET